MSNYGIYDEHINKLRALDKKRFPEPKPHSDVPLNPLSDFLKDKDGNVVPEGEARITKMAIFCVDEVEGVKAIDENGRHITLGKSSAISDRVDRINGLWHVQNKFPHTITRVRDKDMVLMKKLDRIEDTKFEYWSAKTVGYNCFGPFVSSDNSYDYIVARYDTDNGPLWGYGRTLEAARAYLGLKLYDEYKEVIHAIACRNKLKGKAK